LQYNNSPTLCFNKKLIRKKLLTINNIVDVLFVLLILYYIIILKLPRITILPTKSLLLFILIIINRYLKIYIQHLLEVPVILCGALMFSKFDF